MTVSFCWVCGKPLVGCGYGDRVVVLDRLGNRHPIHVTCVDTDDEDLRPAITAQPREEPQFHDE